MSIDVPAAAAGTYQVAPEMQQFAAHRPEQEVPQAVEADHNSGSVEISVLLDQARGASQQHSEAINQSANEADTFIEKADDILRKYYLLHNELEDLTNKHNGNVERLAALHDKYVRSEAALENTEEQIDRTETDIRDKTIALEAVTKEITSDEKSARNAMETIHDETADLNTRIFLAEQYVQEAPDLKPSSYTSPYSGLEGRLEREIQDCKTRLSQLVHQKFALNSTIGITERDFRQLEEQTAELADEITQVVQKIKEYGLMDRLRGNLSDRLLQLAFSRDKKDEEE